MTSFFWVAVATASYAASCGLGAVVKFRLFDSNGVHWLHHAFYICTFILTALAVSTVFWMPGTAGWFLLPALLPLAAIPYVSSHSNNHVYLALSAAPFYIVSLIVCWR